MDGVTPSSRTRAVRARESTRSGSTRTLANVSKLLFDTEYPVAREHDGRLGRRTSLSLFASVLAAYAIARLRFRGADTRGFAIFLAYLVPPRSCSSRWRRSSMARPVRHAWR
jgi:hypothetical protein